MEVELVVTGDGSHTLLHRQFNEHYHSTFGAITESEHVFIRSGLHCFPENSDLTILEVGFGTGLNAFLTAREACLHGYHINYIAIEPFPLTENLYHQLNYPGLIAFEDAGSEFQAIHEAPFTNNLPSKNLRQSAFNLRKSARNKNAGSIGINLAKIRNKLENIQLPEKIIDLVYFDAFSPEVQPEMWTEEIFIKIFHAMRSGGILVTYSAKGSVRRAIKNAGFAIEKLHGPPGKREITRAVKS